VPDIATLIAVEGDDEASFARLRAAEGTGRPLGNAAFIAGLERILGRGIGRRAPPMMRRNCCETGELD
jgi:hypothetical protein